MRGFAGSDGARQYAPVHAQVVAELSGADGRGDGASADTDVVECPTCQAPMQRRGQRTRRGLTRRGVTADLVRDYFVCPACEAGVFPLDETLGLSGLPLQSADPRLAGTLGRRDALCRAAFWLEELTGVVVSAATVRRQTEAVGASAARRPRRRSRACSRRCPRQSRIRHGWRWG